MIKHFFPPIYLNALYIMCVYGLRQMETRVCLVFAYFSQWQSLMALSQALCFMLQWKLLFFFFQTKSKKQNDLLLWWQCCYLLLLIMMTVLFFLLFGVYESERDEDQCTHRAQMRLSTLLPALFTFPILWPSSLSGTTGGWLDRWLAREWYCNSTPTSKKKNLVYSKESKRGKEIKIRLQKNE